MKKFLLSSVFLLVGLPVVANEFKSGDVFYCATTAFANSGSGTEWKIAAYNEQKFKMQITDEVVRFNNEPTFLFIEEEIPVEYLTGDALAAETKFSQIKMSLYGAKMAKLIYSYVGFERFVSMTADCDKF